MKHVKTISGAALKQSQPAKLLVLLQTRSVKTAINNLFFADGIGEKEQEAFAADSKSLFVRDRNTANVFYY